MYLRYIIIIIIYYLDLKTKMTWDIKIVERFNYKRLKNLVQPYA
jgi:hypothetical protein